MRCQQDITLTVVTTLGLFETLNRKFPSILGSEQENRG